MPEVGRIDNRYYQPGVLLAVAALAYGVAGLGWWVDRTDFLSLIGHYGLAFVGYGILLSLPHDRRAIHYLLALGLLLRIVLLFGFPLLSDDVYRFLWDGYLINAGENPFAQLPGAYLEGSTEVPGLTRGLYDRLNSPGYYTIYPPIAQGVFALATWLFPNSHELASTTIQAFLVLCEVGTITLLYRLTGGRKLMETVEVELPLSNSLIYWLNPLILVEISGNLHFEGAMVFFLLLAYWLLCRHRWVGAGIAMAASVASKLLPLLLLPYLIRRLWGRPFWWFSGALGVGLVVFFAPLVAVGFLDGFGSSLDLYFRKFEFNASLYYLAREYGFYQVGYNRIATIGPALAKIAAAGILVLALLDGRSSWRSLPEGWLFAFVLYLLCATTIHPWYLSIPIVLCGFTRWRFPLVWSALIPITYISYTTDPYRENLYVVAVEYLIVAGFAWWEWRYRVSRSSRTPAPPAASAPGRNDP